MSQTFIHKTIKQLALTILAIAFSKTTYSQTTVWQHSYNPVGYNTAAYHMVGHNTGMYTTSVLTRTSDNRKSLHISKFDNATGSEITFVNYHFGSTVTALSIAKTLVDASGNIYVFFQWTISTTGAHDSFVISYSPSLVFRWLNTVNFGFYDDAADMTFKGTTSLIAVVNYAASGYTTGDIGVKEMSLATGTAGISTSFTSSYKKRVNKIQLDASNNIFMCGTNQFMGVTDEQAMLLKFNSAGTYQWVHYYTFPVYISGTLKDIFNDMVIDNSGNVLVAGGGGNVSASGREAYVRKYNTAGALLASHTYSTVTSDEARFIKIDATGNICIAGISNNGIVFMRKLNSALSTLSTITYSLSEPVSSIQGLKDWLLCPNGSSVFLVKTYPPSTPLVNSAWLFKLNASGGVVFNTGFGPATAHQLSFIPTSNFPNNDFAMYIKFSSTNEILTRRYTSPAARVSIEDNSETSPAQSVSIYPNPASTLIKMSEISGASEVMLFDIRGKKVLQQNMSTNDAMDVSHLPRGLYVVKTKLKDGTTQSQKLVLQ